MAMLRFLGSRWFLTCIGAVLIAVLVWVFGPFLSLLEGILPRAVLIVLIALIWGGVNFWLDRRRRKADAALVQGVTAIDPSATASAEEVAAVREKLLTALGLLRKARGTRGYLYEQPWYVIIGPPGAGKTTALLNAGLKFPLATELGQPVVAGVGGTRLCEWMFTDQAVLIDTAGRYTTQDSDAVVDKAGWEAFLDLLKRTRARQPLNGVIVAIALNEIAGASPAERLAHARAIRRRVKELTERLGAKLPVYALLTKADLIAGFTEYFDDLDRERRGQVWGTTFAPAAGEQGPLGAFAAEFRALIERINGRLLERLQTERSAERRAAIAGFPAQVASLEAPLAEFLTEAFGGSRLDPAPWLRGVYMTSGTQEGTPIDRLTGVLARSFGVDQRRAPSLRPQQGRSYFLTRLLADVVFNEAMLVSRQPARVHRSLLLRLGGFAAVLLVTLGLAGALVMARSSATSEEDQAAAALASYEKAVGETKLDPVTDGDVGRVQPLLDQARALPYGYNVPEQSGGMLSQQEKLGTAARVLYRHALERMLLPRMIWRLESQMRAALNQPAFLYEATRVYLMLGAQGPLDRDGVRAWMAADWARLYPGAVNAPGREVLAKHLDALLDGPLPRIPLDGALIEDARRAFSRISLAQRVYASIQRSAAAQRLAPWTPAQALGASGARLFVRASGKPLTEGIDGFFTVDGFHKVLLPALPRAAGTAAGESWVLGAQAEVDPSSPQMRSLEHDVVALYVADYGRVWQAMLDDLNLVQLRGLGQASQDLYILSSPQSPMRDLLAGIARQLTLSVPSPAPPGASGAVAQATAAVTSGAAARVQAVLGQDAGPPPEPPGKEIDDRYKPLRDFVGTGPGAPIDLILKLLSDLQQQLAKIAAAPPGTPMVPTGEDPSALLQAEATRQPQPVARWLASVSGGGSALRGGGAKQALAAAFNGGGGPGNLCKQAVDNRFPFRVGTPSDIPLDDFARLFAPGGMLDGFFNTQLRPFVDTSGRVWKPQAADGVQPPVSADTVAQFQRAAAIRDLFFAGGGTQPGVRFDITPVELDAGAKQVTLDLDGMSVTYAHGPLRSTQVIWPGANRMNNVRLVFDPPPAGASGTLQESGPWALFRLFGRGNLVQGSAPELYRLSFKIGEREAVFEIRAGSVLNPFAPGTLRDFRCPGL
jgi:type VI secretion system protein ImpL